MWSVLHGSETAESKTLVGLDFTTDLGRLTVKILRIYFPGHLADTALN